MSGGQWKRKKDEARAPRQIFQDVLLNRQTPRDLEVKAGQGETEKSACWRRRKPSLVFNYQF